MKVTLIHQYFKLPREGGAIRSYYLTKGLVEAGHEVDIITAHNEKEFQIKRIEGAKVFYLPIYYDNKQSKYQRIWAFIKYVWSTIALLYRLKKPDILYTISTPLTVGVVALWMKWLRAIPYIFEIGDLWPEAPIQLGYIRNSLLKWSLHRFEKLIYKQAHRIVAMSPDIEQIINQGSKVVMIPNMADCDFFLLEEKSVELLEKYNLNDEFIIAYLGTAGRANHLEYLLQAAKALQYHQLTAKILLAAEGSELEHFRALVLENELDNIVFAPYTNKNGVREMLSVSDAVYVSFANVPILASGSPNKFFDGLAAGKIIITNFGGWVKKEIEKHGCGFGYNPDNPNEFIQMLTPYITDESFRNASQKKARQLAEKKYARKILIKQWIHVFE